jgi:hypothetical protein
LHLVSDRNLLSVGFRHESQRQRCAYKPHISGVSIL